MTMNGKTQSILLQVAFKEAVSSTQAQGIYSEADVEKRTVDFYAMLVGLHDKLGINADDQPTRGGGSSRSYSGGRASTTTAKQDAGTGFFFNDRIVNDYRQAKLDGKVKAQHPDFKALDNQALPGGALDKDGNVTGSVWLIDRDGNPNNDAAELLELAGANV